MLTKTKERQPSEHSQNNYETAKKQPKHHQPPVDSTPKRSRYEDAGSSPQMRRNRLSKESLMQMYKQLMENSQYSEAERANRAIIHIGATQARKKQRRLSENHSQEKEAVRRSHLWEMQVFRQSWGQVFAKQQQHERHMLHTLQELRRRDEMDCRDRIARRCQSAKPRLGFARLN